MNNNIHEEWPETEHVGPPSAPKWGDRDAWSIIVHTAELSPKWRPYTGNGFLGLTWGELVAFSENDTPFTVLSKIVYDAGHQLLLPEWHRLKMKVGGVPYELSIGQHKIVQRLDLRCGRVTQEDDWEYKPGFHARICLSLSVLRNFRHGACLSISISEVSEPVILSFGLRAASLQKSYEMAFKAVDENCVIGSYETPKQQRAVCQGLAWSTSGFNISPSEPCVDEQTINATNKGGDCQLELYHAVHSYVDGGGAQERVIRDLNSMRTAGVSSLEEGNQTAWKPLWARALDCSSLGERIGTDIRIHQFYLLASLDEYSHPLGATGLSRLSWRGNMLWDADLWIFRAILPLWPEFARALLHFRFLTLEAAYDNAKRLGYEGACFPWSAGDDGKEYAVSHNIHFQHHVNIWIVMGFLEYYRQTGDLDFLREEGWPVIKGIIEFWKSRMTVQADGRRHILGVVGPDEAVAETGTGTCDDNYLTNLGVRHLMNWATEVAVLLGKTPVPQWQQARQEIYIPSPGNDGVIPEFAGYSGQRIKQADVILTFYLLDHGLDQQTVLKNIEYYHDKIQQSGPLMNSQIEACITIRAGFDKDTALERLLEEYEAFVRSPYRLTYECRTESNKNVVFLTAPAGLLQALIYGYYGHEVGVPNRFPTIGDSW